MRVLIPVDITDAMLISHSVPEPAVDEPLLVLGTNYAVLDVVSSISTDLHKLYLRKKVGDVNAVPVPKPNETEFWRDIGNTNAWKMFDPDRNSRTVGDSPMTVKLRPGQRITCAAITGMVADHIDFTVRENGMVVYNQNLDLQELQVNGWFDYFFEPFSTKENVWFPDMPPVIDPEITLTLTRNEGLVECGGFKIGGSVFIGGLSLGATGPRINFSKVERDPEFGDVELTPRKNVPTLVGRLFVKKSQLPKVEKTLLSLEARVTVWAGTDDSDHGYFPTTFINGFLREQSPALLHPNDCTIDIEIEEI